MNYILGFTLFPHIGGIAGAFITKRNIDTFYNNLEKPSWLILKIKYS
jgi:hypothetical protein